MYVVHIAVEMAPIAKVQGCNHMHKPVSLLCTVCNHAWANQL
jgi:hypothetical protein